LEGYKETMVRDTSIKCYKEIIEEGILGKMELKVFELIYKNPFLSDNELCGLSGLKINQLTARRNGLIDQGLVIDAGVKEIEHHDGTLRYVHIWAVPNKIHYKPKNLKLMKKCPTCKGNGWVLK
jgi:hypothetical protein